MASFEGPAPLVGELAGADLSAPPQDPVPEIPALTPERSLQELSKLSTIIKATESLGFLEPRVAKCTASGGADLVTLLSFYRLVSQSLSEELSNQKARLDQSEKSLAQTKQSSAQQQMQAALDEASHAVQQISRSDGGGTSLAVADGASPTDGALAQKLEQAEKQAERLLQDMQNMRNRNKIDVDVRVFKELEKFCHSLLPALDAFNHAMPTLQTTTDISSIVTGVTMIHDQLLESLGKAGLKRLHVVGEHFDPRLHESIGDVPTSDIPDEHVYDELQAGYILGERLIRAAMVRLAKNDSPTPAPPVQAPPPPDATADPPPAATPSIKPADQVVSQPAGVPLPPRPPVPTAYTQASSPTTVQESSASDTVSTPSVPPPERPTPHEETSSTNPNQ